MSTKTVVMRLDELLTPLGFEWQKRTWNRRSGSLIDVIDVQVSKAGDAMTVNAGVMDPVVRLKCWGTDPPGFVEEPQCTVRVRVGQLIGTKDVWWSSAMVTPSRRSSSSYCACAPVRGAHA